MSNRAGGRAFLNIAILRSGRGAELTVEHVEVVTERSHHRIRPRHDKRLEGSLDVRLAAFLRSRLSDATADTMLLHEPEATLRLPAVVLSNLQTIATVLADGTRKVVFRFSRIAGEVRTALRSSAEGLRSSIQQIAVSAYERVLREAVALMQTAEQMPAGGKNEALLRSGHERLRRDMEALSLQIDLLERHVERCVASVSASVPFYAALGGRGADAGLGPSEAAPPGMTIEA